VSWQLNQLIRASPSRQHDFHDVLLMQLRPAKVQSYAALIISRMAFRKGRGKKRNTFATLMERSIRFIEWQRMVFDDLQDHFCYRKLLLFPGAQPQIHFDASTGLKRTPWQHL